MRVQVGWRGVALYLALAFGLAWLIEIGLRAFGVNLLTRASLAMLAPAVAAYLVRGPLLQEGFRDSGAGFNLDQWKYYGLAYIISPVLIALGVLLALVVQEQHWALDANVHRLAHQLHLGHGTSVETRLYDAWVVFWAGVGNSLSVAIVFNAIFTFGEEFGWWGYLLPRLAPLGGVMAAVMVGIIWGFWHAPLIALDGYNFPGYPVVGIFAMLLFTVPLSVIMTWLRFRSRSVWPGVLLHAAINGQATVVVLLLSKGDSLLRPPVGLLGTIPFWLLAAWLIWTHRLEPSGQSKGRQPVGAVAPESGTSAA